MDKFRDPIHGFIEVSDFEKQIIDSRPFLRLRNIKQLAMTYYVYHGAEHTRFGHSLGVMHLVTRAFDSAIKGYEDKFGAAKIAQFRQILRLIALTHDIGHAPFSHASEAVFPDDMEHEDYTEKIVKETEIAKIIRNIGSEFVRNYGEEYNITPELICDIYMGVIPGANSEYTFLKTFMDSELDCDKMDYLLRDSYYCGVKYGMYDVDRLIESFTIYFSNDIPRLAIKSSGVPAFEEFVLARYFMFIQVYFHHTRRFLDIMLANALKDILPNGVYPENVQEYLKWDDCRVIQLMKEHEDDNQYCKNIITRNIYPRVYNTKTHPSESDKREFKRHYIELRETVGKENLITDSSAKKNPHNIPLRVAVDDENSIPIYNEKLGTVSTISEESEAVHGISKRIDIQSIYCHPDYSEQAIKQIRKINEALMEVDNV